MVTGLSETPQTRKYFTFGRNYVELSDGGIFSFGESDVCGEVDSCHWSNEAYSIYFIHGLGQTGTVSKGSIHPFREIG